MRRFSAVRTAGDMALVPAARGTATVAVRVAHGGVLVAGASLPISMIAPEVALAISLLAVCAARAAGLGGHRRSPLDLPVAIAVTATLVALGIARATGAPAPPLEAATRFRAFLVPVVVLSALSLPLPGDEPDAVRERAVRVLLAWCLAALVASAIGIVQGAAGIDPLFVLGVRPERLPPVPGWPGHFAATGFFSGYARFGQSLLAPLTLAAALAAGGGLPPRRRVLLAVTASVAATATVFSALRSGWASLAAGALALVALGGPRARRVLLPLCGAAVALALVHPGLRLRLAALMAGEGNGDRQMIWRICGVMRDDHPLGIGPGGFGGFAAAYWSRIAPGTSVASGCHSLPFHLLVEGGPLLLAGCLVATALVGWTFWRAARATGADPLARAAAVGALAALVALVPSALFHDLVRAVQVSYSVGVVLGLAAALTRLPGPSGDGRLARSPERASQARLRPPWTSFRRSSAGPPGSESSDRATWGSPSPWSSPRRASPPTASTSTRRRSPR
jgi:hypothetical protein